MTKEFLHPRGNVFYRRMNHPHPLIERGAGACLYDAAGNRYIDASGGPILVNVGHGVAEIVNAMAEQAQRVAYVHAEMFTSAAVEEFSAELAEVTPMPAPRFFYLSSGSEAIETAIKFARQLQVARGEARRDLVISRWFSYHGTTFGALAVTGKMKMRKLYAPMFRDMPHIPPPYCYRCPFKLSYPSCDVACADALEREILLQGKERVAALLVEPISGATLGAVVPPPKYLPRIREICDEYGVLLIADEVMTGFGRTGTWFGVEHWNITPDVMTMAKGIAGGYFPLAVAAMRGDLVEEVRDAHGDFSHGGTYSHHAVGAAAGSATLRYLREHDLIHSAAHKGKVLGESLQTALADSLVVGDIRGIGMMWGIEFVADKRSKEPLPTARHFARAVADAAFRRGVILYPGAGSVDGTRGDHLMVAPPFVITETEMGEVIAILREVIVDMIAR